MKKILLLSVVASGLIYAGGDIAPVAPVQVTPAATVAPAACNFWGSIGARYDANDDDTSTTEFADAKNNRFLTTVVLGTEQELGYGFGFGAELAANILTDGKFKKIPNRDKVKSELSQLYLTYKNGNTTIKAGRQALPKSVSPLAFSVRNVGALERTYNGVVVVNTDIQDTTLVGAWVRSVADGNKNTKVGDKGIFMLGAINKSITNTTLSTALYYAKAGDNLPKDFVSAWASAETKLSSTKLGLQLAYSKLKGLDKTFGVAAYGATAYNGFNAKLTLAYINDGAAPLTLNSYGAPKGTYAPSSGFWGGTYRLFGGNANPKLGKQKIARLDLSYKVKGYGTVYGGVAVDKPDNAKTAVAARAGYKFKIADVNAKVEYRYNKDFGGVKHQRVRVEGIYKF